MSTTPHGSAFASDDLKTITLSTGETIDLAEELCAGDAMKLLRMISAPTPSDDTEILLMFLQGWSITTQDGKTAPITQSSLDALKLGHRTEIMGVVQGHAIAYLASVIPTSLRAEGTDDPLAQTGTTETDTASTPPSPTPFDSVSGSRKARRKS